jgi:prepilin-type N-terminal cleavage/methylation domain-containing protein
MSSKPRRGFTLLEMAVVLAVVGVGASLLLPRLGDLRALEVEAAAQRLADDLTLAREQAILGGASRQARLDLDRGTWTIGAGETTQLPAALRLRTVEIDGHVIVAGRVTLELDPVGDPLPARIELADARGHGAGVVLPPVMGPARVVP